MVGMVTMPSRLYQSCLPVSKTSSQFSIQGVDVSVVADVVIILEDPGNNQEACGLNTNLPFLPSRRKQGFLWGRLQILFPHNDKQGMVSALHAAGKHGDSYQTVRRRFTGCLCHRPMAVAKVLRSLVEPCVIDLMALSGIHELPLHHFPSIVPRQTRRAPPSHGLKRGKSTTDPLWDMDTSSIHIEQLASRTNKSDFLSNGTLVMVAKYVTIAQ